MRLERYMTEVNWWEKKSSKEMKSMPWEELIPQMEKIEKECSQIIKVYKNTGTFLFRGVKEKGWIIEKTGRGTKVRKPRNTPIEYHRFMNKLFKDKLGWKVRDGISTTTQAGWADFYGEAYIFFPKNGYKFAWSEKYGDLFRDLPILSVTIPGKMTTKEWLQKKKKTFQRAVNTYTDKNLEAALKKASNQSVGEILFKVNKYYLVNAQLTQRVREYFDI